MNPKMQAKELSSFKMPDDISTSFASIDASFDHSTKNTKRNTIDKKTDPNNKIDQVCPEKLSSIPNKDTSYIDVDSFTNVFQQQEASDDRDFKELMSLDDQSKEFEERVSYLDDVGIAEFHKLLKSK